MLVALISFAIINWGYKDWKLATAFSIGVLSHIILDILFHEKDIRLSPFSDTPVWGFWIIDYPFLNFILELTYGVFCWWYFRGGKVLLIVIFIFNIIDLPMMLARGEILEPFDQHPVILPTIILFQILTASYFIWRYGKVTNAS